MSSALLSGGPGARSTPASLLARATWYQTSGTGALGKLEKIWMAPAEPRTAELAVQVRGSKLARTKMGTLLSRIWPQMLAAYWKAERRCAPMVAPGLPPAVEAGSGAPG